MYQCDQKFMLNDFVHAANVVVCERNKDETKLLLGCDNGILVGSWAYTYVCIYMYMYMYMYTLTETYYMYNKLIQHSVTCRFYITASLEKHQRPPKFSS